MAKKKLQVFISSTFTDMRAERQAVVEAVLEAGHIPAGMELFAAGDQSQLEVIRRWIDDSDVFALILGGRYGTIEPKSGKSYIQLEYEYAQEKNKPYFAAVIGDAFLEAKVKGAGTPAIETQHGDLRTAFRDKVKQKICRFFDDLNQLKLIVFQSLANFDRDESLVGWIRSSDAIDAKATLEEIERLQAENARLRSITDTLRSTGAEDPVAIANNLSGDDKQLLTGCANGGKLNCFISYNDTFISGTGQSTIAKGTGHRARAHWLEVVEGLLNRRLISGQFQGSRGDFELTDLGYRTVDAIQSAGPNENS